MDGEVEEVDQNGDVNYSAADTEDGGDNADKET